MNIFPTRLVDSVNGMIGKVKVLVARALDFNLDDPYILEIKDQDGNLIDSVPITIDNVQDLRTNLTDKENRIVSLEGFTTETNQTAQEIYFRDGEGNLLATLNVAFLNNEGTTFIYNETTEKLELRNDQGDLLSEIPVSSFVSNLAKSLSLSGASITLRDTEGNPLSTITLTPTTINTALGYVAQNKDEAFRYYGQISGGQDILTVVDQKNFSGYWRISGYSGNTPPTNMPSGFVYHPNSNHYVQLVYLTDGTTRRLQLTDYAGNIFTNHAAAGWYGWLKNSAQYDDSQINQDLIDHINDTSNPHNVTADQVGLGNVDNTSDIDKPVSTAQQTEIDQAEADAITWVQNQNYLTEFIEQDPKGISTISVTGSGTKTITVTRNDNTTATATFTDKDTTYVNMTITELNTGTATTGRVISAKTLNDWLNAKGYATQTALNNHINNTNNPHQVTAAQVGLGNVDNTSDLNKPVSTQQQQAIDQAEADAIQWVQDQQYVETEQDPTVPQHVKDITQNDIDSWNSSTVDQDNKVRVIQISEDDLPTNFTEQDVLDYLNSTGITISDKEIITWETVEGTVVVELQVQITTPTEGQEITGDVNLTFGIINTSGISIITPTEGQEITGDVNLTFELI